VIRRDFDITGPVALPSIDVVSEGAAMMPVAFELSGAEPDDILTTHLYLMLGSGFTSFDPTPGAAAQVVPPSLLHTNDNQLLSLDAVAGPLSRNAFMFYVDGETPTTIALPPRLTDVQFGPSRASWVTIPDGLVELYLLSGLTSVHATATHGWLGTKTELVIDTDLPGFRPEWKVQQADFQQLDVSYDATGVSLRTAIQDSPSLPPSVARRAALNARVRMDHSVSRRLRHRGR